MDTERLIKAMAADAGPAGPGFAARWAWAVVAAVVVAAAVFAGLLTPRADLATAATTPRFMLKLGVMAVLALTAVPLLPRLARPGAALGRRALALAAAPLLLAAGLVVEWNVLDGDCGAALMGRHNLACVGLVTLIGLGPLAVFLAFLRQGAPTAPARAGALAGLASGGIAATLYALHCTDDSPFFVLAWYGLALAALTALGALLAPKVARW